MRIFNFRRYAINVCVAAATLCGCGGSQPPIGAPGAMPPRTSALSSAIGGGLQERERTAGPEVYKVSSPLLYVVDFAHNNVRIYDASGANPAPIASITRGINNPGSDCIDKAGTLYVPNQLGWITEYALGHTRAIGRITKDVHAAAACAIDAHGNLWVAVLDGYVVEYQKGQTTPYKVITRGVPFPVGIAIDHSRNIYVSNRLGSSSGNVVVFSPGAKRPTRTITDGVTSPVGITVDAKGTLYVTNIRESNVEEYLAGQSHPYQTITQGLNSPAAATVNKRGRLYVCNFGNNVVVEFAPGSLTPSKKEIKKRLYTPQGSAYYPPLLP